MVYGLTIGVFSVILLFVVFLTGIFVGRRESGFFFLGRMHMQGTLSGRYGHGAIGTIDSLGKNTIVLKERSGELETVLIDNNTVLRKNDSNAKFSDLKKSDEVIVIGEPQEREEAVRARFIRIINEK